jgi:xylose isomerase
MFLPTENIGCNVRHSRAYPWGYGISGQWLYRLDVFWGGRNPGYSCIKKVDTQLHLTREKLAEELGILVFTVSNIVANKNNILKQGESSKPCKSQQFLDPCKMFSLLRSSCLICWKIS